MIDYEREDGAVYLGGDICAVDKHISSNEGIVGVEGRVDALERKKLSGWYRQRRYEEESSVSFSEAGLTLRDAERLEIQRVCRRESEHNGTSMMGSGADTSVECAEGEIEREGRGIREGDAVSEGVVEESGGDSA